MSTDAVLVCTSHHRAQAITEALQGAGWSVRSHLDPDEALRDIRANGYDALFCDERLRGASPSGFLSWHQRLAPEAPFYVIAYQGSELVTPLRGRAARVLPYPLTADAVPMSTGRTQWRRVAAAEPRIPLQGDTGTVPLTHLLELLGLNDASATVDTPAGAIHLSHGHIEHASFVAAPGAESVHGLRALSELIAARDLAFKVLPHRAPPLRSINQPIMTALTDAAWQRDESLRNRRLMDAVAHAHPQATGLAVGYPLNAAANDAWGDGMAAHALLHRYARATHGLATLAKPIHLALESEGVAWALLALRRELVLSGTTKPGKSLRLLSAMAKGARMLAAEDG